LDNRQKTTQAANPISPGRKKFFWAVTLLFPFLLIILIELFLRAFHYGDSLDLVVTKHAFGKDWYTLNSTVGQRYFSQEGIAIPEPYDDVFEIQKQKTTKRIFMLGESTMAGYPFDYNATAPRLLKDRLQLLLPQYNIEVINAGLAAINSFTVLDFIEELVDYEPDAFVIYVGHNEFYGALGVASTESMGNSPWIIKTYLAIRRYKTVMVLRDFLSWVKATPSETSPSTESTLMAKMVREKAIRYESPEYQLAKENFSDNLSAIIAVAQDHHIPVLFSTLTSNIRDQNPLQSSFSPGTSTATQATWNELYQEGRAQEHNYNFEKAITSYTAAIALDSMQADAYFRLGKCYDTLGTYSEAKISYQKARDLDALRFRASGEFNTIIRNTCKELGVPIADADSTFDNASPHGIVGANLMLEHLHPNFDGYYLLSKTFFQTIVQSNMLTERSEYHWENDLDDISMKQHSGVTEFDLTVARYRVSQLTKGWPFHYTDSLSERRAPQLPIQQLAEAYVHKRIPWSQARFDLASFYLKEQRYDDAIGEYTAVTKVIPLYYYPWLSIGDVYQIQGKTENAEGSYRKALSLEDSPFVHVRLGMLYFEKDNVEKAIQEFELTLRSELQSKEKMKQNELSMLRYFLGASYGRRGDLQNAKRNLQIALQINPDNIDAKKLLNQIPK
jgi:tetratricopeptide (TPR) repeat protein